MLLQLMCKLGKNLYENGQDVHIGCNYIEVGYQILIDYKGQFLGIEQLHGRQKVWNPLAFWEDKFSSAASKYYMPHLLFGRLEQLVCEDYFEKYLTNIKLLKSYVNDWRVEAISCFLFNGRVSENIIKDLSLKTNYVYVVVDKDGIRHEIWKEEDFQKQVERMFLERLQNVSEEDKICDITGDITKTFILVHSKYSTGSIMGSRALSSRTYKYYYGGKNEANISICNVGGETEAYLDIAFHFVMSKKRPIKYNRWYYFGDEKGKCYLPLHTSLDEWGSIYDMDITCVEDWLLLKNLIVDDIGDSSLFFLEFGAPHKGRMSTYNAIRYSKSESKKILTNILTWMELISFEMDRKTRSYSISNMVGEFLKNEKETIRSNEYSLYFKYLIKGEYEKILWHFWVPWVTKKYKMFDRVISKMVLILRGLYEVENLMDNPTYLAGELYAWAYLLEKRYNWYSGKKESNYVQIRLEKYLKNPFLTWLEIRKKVEIYKAQLRGAGTDIYIKIQELSHLLTFKYDFNKMNELDGIALLGYDKVICEYWGEKKKESVDNEKL